MFSCYSCTHILLSGEINVFKTGRIGCFTCTMAIYLPVYVLTIRKHSPTFNIITHSMTSVYWLINLIILHMIVSTSCEFIIFYRVNHVHGFKVSP